MVGAEVICELQKIRCWSRVLNGVTSSMYEPLALVADGDRIVFTLWSRGIYCTSSDSTEIWRSPLRVDGPPMSNVKQLFMMEKHFMWSRNGDHSILFMDDGSVISSHQYGVDIDLDLHILQENISSPAEMEHVLQLKV